MIIEKGFLITEDTAYQEIADYLVESDPKGVSDLVMLIMEKVPGLISEVLSWPMVQREIPE